MGWEMVPVSGLGTEAGRAVLELVAVGVPPLQALALVLVLLAAELVVVATLAVAVLGVLRLVLAGLQRIWARVPQVARRRRGETRSPTTSKMTLL